MVFSFILLYMVETTVCEICGEKIVMEPENAQAHRGGSIQKLGVVSYEDGEPKYVCREHLSL